MRCTRYARLMVFYWLVGSVAAQTQVDLRTQSKGIDFQAAPYTKPFRASTPLPGTCTPNELFFLTTAPAGSNVYACVATNTWALEAGGSVTLSGDVTGPANATSVQRLQSRAVSAAAPQVGQALIWDGSTWSAQTVASGGGGGSLSVENNGTLVGARGMENFIPGFGLINAITDSGTAINVQQSVDTSILLSQGSHQAGQVLLCKSTSASGTAYTCAMSPTLGAYQQGMVLNWNPDVDGAGGATTLNVDALGAIAVRLADGVTNPVGGDIAGGQQYPIWFDGANFRLIAPPSMVQGSAAARPACDVAHRGRIWQIFSAAGSKDDVSICAKDATNAYAWRALY
jgi:hypothetical protein